MNTVTPSAPAARVYRLGEYMGVLTVESSGHPRIQHGSDYPSYITRSLAAKMIRDLRAARKGRTDHE